MPGQNDGWLSEGDFAKVVGSRLKRLREEQSLAQDALARQLGISKSSIAKYEAGVHTPPAGVLVRLAATLYVSLDALLGPAGGPRPFHDPRLLWCLREIEAMDEETRHHVTLTLEALINGHRQLLSAQKKSAGRAKKT